MFTAPDPTTQLHAFSASLSARFCVFLHLTRSRRQAWVGWHGGNQIGFLTQTASPPRSAESWQHYFQGECASQRLGNYLFWETPASVLHSETLLGFHFSLDTQQEFTPAGCERGWRLKFSLGISSVSGQTIGFLSAT